MGDCLVLSWGDRGDVRHMVVDGGRSSAWPHLRNRLEAIAAARETVERFVITHIDADHIEGALKFARDADRPLVPGQVWFNGLDQMTALAPHGERQGDDMSNRIGMMVENRAYYASLPEEEIEEEDDPASDETATGSSENDGAPHDAEAGDRRDAIISSFDATGDNLVARTYLTPGWKYVERMVRNTAPEALKGVLGGMTFAKFVYVTEFAFRDEIESLNPCERRIRAHVVVDPTANDYDEPPISHIPGLLLVNAQELDGADNDEQLWIYLLEDDGPYRPKVRGWRDYTKCGVPPDPAAS